MLDFYWSFLLSNFKRYLKIAVGIFILCFLIDQVSACSPLVRYPLVMMKRPFYQMKYASGKEKIPFQRMVQVLTPFQDPNPYQVIKLNGKEISKTFVSVFRGYGRVAYLDVNDALIKGWYLSSANEKNAWLYKKVVPYDILMTYGELAKPENFKTVSFSHEENMGRLSWENGRSFNVTDWENIHILPANKRIKKAVSLLKKGDEVYLEGFLTDWDDKNVPHDKQGYKTSRYIGEISKQRAGGNASVLCQQLFLTKIILNGYVYK